MSSTKSSKYGSNRSVKSSKSTKSSRCESVKSAKAPKSIFSSLHNYTISEASHTTSANSLYQKQLEHKAKLRVSKSRLKYVEMEADLLREQAQIDINMKILSARREAEEAEAEYEVYCEESQPPHSDPPSVKSERIKQFVQDCDPHIGTPENLIRTDTNNIPYTQPVSIADPNTLNPINEPRKAVSPLLSPTHSMGPNYDVVSQFTKLFLKKELLIQRLTTFNDKPENYLSWKSSFFDIVQGLDVNVSEEFDLLIRYLGPESSEQAKRMRSANLHDLRNGLERVWNRLDERYGSPELINNVLKEKIANFPKFSGTSHDMSKLYDLVDILSEIQSVKENPKYNCLLSYYDSSMGVNSIVHKLPSFLKSKWMDRASKLKQENNILFPPFKEFVEFIQEMSKRYNDPSLQYYETGNQKSTLGPTQISAKSRSSNSSSHYDKSRTVISAKKTEISSYTSPVSNKEQDNSAKHNTEVKTRMPASSLPCLTHTFTNGGGHTINQCREFRTMSIADRKNLLLRRGVCFRCCEGKHLAKDCDAVIRCQLCQSRAHPSALHYNTVTSVSEHGGETETKINSLCTEICGPNFSGKSCAKISLVNVHSNENLGKTVKMYAIIDDQSNHSLATTAFFNIFNVKGPDLVYTLKSCSGNKITSGRRASGFTISSLDGTFSIQTPTLIECNEIPNQRDEIPTKEVALHYPHLADIARYIPPIDNKADILLLLGRDMTSVHHVHDQRIGPRNSPYAQKLSFGWVIIGETCLGKVHIPDSVNVNKTYLLPNGRTTLLPPCQSINIQNHDVFLRTPDDDKLGPSIEDTEFIEKMGSSFRQTENGNWSAPLPFKKKRPGLPNNYEHALQRAQSLKKSLRCNPNKQKQFHAFMDNIFAKGHAEVAPPLQPNEECWYLPIFGVFHPKKPGKIRVVYDSSAKFHSICLNDVLITGPDLTNSLLGVLLRFRKERVAIVADVEQMFFNFYVHEEHRNFLRFLWHRNNDPDQELITWRMNVHVFGNSPSPSVSTYGLCKCACDQETHDDTCDDVCRFVRNDFYVDDGLTSLPDTESAVSLVKRTQDRLMERGNIRLHKIMSNDPDLLKEFPKSDLATDLREMDFDSQIPSLQRSLGLTWNILSDTFTYQVSSEEKPFTRRGMLSTINSIFDPIGFLAPVILGGKLILRNALIENADWDQPLRKDFMAEWQAWTSSLQRLQNLHIPRTYTEISFQNAIKTELLIFCDASKEAIASVAYIRIYNSENQTQQGFVMGKSKLAPTNGHTVPRLELCAAVLAVEVASFVTEQIHTRIDSTKFFTDSKIVLGYINNESRRFYVYVTNRLDKIRKASLPSQWFYVPTNLNPADQATRPSSVVDFEHSSWLTGPLPDIEDSLYQIDLNLVEPDSDKEVRPEVSSFMTVTTSGLGSKRFERFSSWHNLAKAISFLKRKAASVHTSNLDENRTFIDFYQESERLILKSVQHDLYTNEIEYIQKREQVPKASNIVSLSPYIDSDGLLKVGGRLKRSNLSDLEKNPCIISGKHHVSTLVVRHFHEKIFHQGRHLTEGAVRSAGYWVTGGKRLISSIIHNCVKCRRLRSRTEVQKMSDLPEDRIVPTPPFTNVGVDTFGPWSVVSRRTRGGHAHSKRWAVIFSCLVTRAIHIEVVEDLSSSSFINSLRRFVSLRGPVKIFRSDRGTNFIGAVEDLNIEAINVEDGPVQDFLLRNGSVWKFNAPHASHMAGAWERMIGLTRRILDSMLLNVSDKNLTHEVLCTFMCEVCAIVNSRPLVAVSTDPTSPVVLSPSILLTQKTNSCITSYEHLDIKDMYKAQWRHVQVLAERFWKQWQQQYLQNLQMRSKWTEDRKCLKLGDIVLLKDNQAPRNQWPIGIISETYPSKDGIIRKVSVRIRKDNEVFNYTRPIAEVVYLLSS